jgi:hypothetical protein
MVAPVKSSSRSEWQTASGSNEGDAGRAADCFAEDAVYIEPPDCEFVGESLF